MSDGFDRETLQAAKDYSILTMGVSLVAFFVVAELGPPFVPVVFVVTYLVAAYTYVRPEEVMALVQ